jgi:hypothetical protein
MTTSDNFVCKEEFLPIEKTDFGYVQKTKYYQPDLYHEEVIELDSPFASIVPSGTQVYTFLLLGDQNAGKSTFIHSFTYHPDPNFLELSTTLPILTSTFINTRFLIGNFLVYDNNILGVLKIVKIEEKNTMVFNFQSQHSCFVEYELRI